MNEKNSKYCIVDYSVKPNKLKCTICGETFEIKFPISTGMFCTLGKQFIKEHRICGGRKKKI